MSAVLRSLRTHRRSARVPWEMYAGFLLMGFSFTLTQAFMIRELLASFFGNELSLAFILGNWLLLEAAGSACLGRWLSGRVEGLSGYAGLQMAFAALLPVCLIAAYASRWIAGALPGVGVGWIPTFYTSLLVLAPLGLVDGAMFTMGCQALVAWKVDVVPSSARVYSLEAIGSIVGGLIFTFVLIPYLRTAQVTLMLAALNLISASSLLRRARMASGKRRAISLWPIVGACGLAMMALTTLPPANALHRLGIQLQWQGLEPLETRRSPYGDLAVLRRGEQLTFFMDGLPMITAPVPDILLSEELVHLPLLFHPTPRTALIIGGGVGGVLQELEKYPLERIDYAELDPVLIDMVREYPSVLTGSEMADRRLMVSTVDGRLLMRSILAGKADRPQRGYDLILVNMALPTTLQQNRYYTREFLQMAMALLAPDGLVAMTTPGSLSYLGPELSRLNATLLVTLRELFPAVRVVPDETTIWIAFRSAKSANLSPEALLARWSARGMKTHALSEAYLAYKLSLGHEAWLLSQLKPLEGHGLLGGNSDVRPLAMRWALAYWDAVYSPPGSAFRNMLWGDGPEAWAMPVLLAGGFMAWCAAGWLRGERWSIPLAITATGMAGMLADLMVLFAFQIAYGHLFQWVALILAAFMGGLSAGSLLAPRWLAGRARVRRRFLLLEGLMVGYWVVFALLFLALHHQGAIFVPSWAIKLALMALNVAAGFIVGAQFPLANALWAGEPGGGAAGALYGLDLLGAYLGATLLGALLLPRIGLLAMAVLMGCLKLCTMLVVGRPCAS